MTAYGVSFGSSVSREQGVKTDSARLRARLLVVMGVIAVALLLIIAPLPGGAVVGLSAAEMLLGLFVGAVVLALGVFSAVQLRK